MDVNTVKELASFLFDVKPEVRMVAASHLLSVSGSEEGLKVLCSDEKLLAEVTENMARSLAGSHEFAKIAVSTLVNISDQPVVQERLLRSIGSICALVTDAENPAEIQELAAMLLANLTRSPGVVKQLLEMDSEFAGRRFLSLVGKFFSSKESEPGARDPFAWLALVLQNCSQSEDARRFLLDQRRSVMAHAVKALLPSSGFKDVRRRRGVIATIRNCLLETAHHVWLTEPPINLHHAILILLVPGRGTFDDTEKRAMPVDLRDIVFEGNHEPEPDTESRRLLVECLTTIQYHANISTKIKAISAYPIIRELERFEKDREVIDRVYDCVELLLREHESGSSAVVVAAPAIAAAETAAQVPAKTDDHIAVALPVESPPATNAGKSSSQIQQEILDIVADENALEVCAVCQKSPPDVKGLSRCTGCLAVAYCGRAHQSQHWSVHKEICLKKQAELKAMVEDLK